MVSPKRSFDGMALPRSDNNQKDQQAAQIFGSGKHELKLGKSFQEDNSCGFHTIRYDFKPASVDHSREATLDVGESNEVNITFPNIENKGPDSTVFGGSKKPYQKECVLIFDHRTGEFTLERLSCNIQVKRQRQEGTSKAQLPPRTLHGPSKSSPNPRSSTSHGSKKKADNSTPISSPAAPVETKVERSPAPQPSPLAASEPSPAPASAPSFADKGGDSSDSYISASDSDNDDSSSGSSSGSSSSDSDDDNEDDRRHSSGKKRTEQPSERGSHKLSPAQVSPLNVSPQLLQLSEDLQLSESGSDSD